MSVWRKLSGGDARDFQRRGLVRYRDAPDVQLMLSLAHAADRQWAGIYRDLKKWAHLNEGTFDRFLRAKDRQQRIQIIAEAEASGRATRPLVEVMKRDARTMRY